MSSDNYSVGVLLVVLGIALIVYGFGTALPVLMIFLGFFIMSPWATVFLLGVMAVIMAIMITLGMLGIVTSPIWGPAVIISWLF